jgi:ABC-type multidrug transport system fused ATPase/permease subunit
LLKALIQEAQVSAGKVAIRSSPFDEVSFAGQYPWLHHGTIRENILFGSTFLKSRYDEVIESTGLGTDLLDLSAGDSTEVGERGQSLSGGQRARVALARAIYARTETVLLDDVLAALDATTSGWVVEKCILGSLLKGRTVVLITEDQKCCQEAALLVEISSDGQVKASRPDRSALEVRISDNEAFFSRTSSSNSEAPGEVTPVADAANELEAKPSDKSEKLMTGLIGRMSILKYMRLFGSLPFLSIFCTLILLSQASDVLLSLWLTVWSGKSVGENSHQPHNDNTFYLGIYASIGVVQISLVCVSSLVFFYGALRASRKEHSRMLASVIGASITWVTTTPVGRILNRFSSDMFSLDNTITELLKQVVENFLSIGFRLAAVSSILPAFLAPAALLLAMGLYIGQMYLYGSTAAKRIYAAGLSPILTSINDVVSGIEVIRAHRAEPAFQNHFFQSLEHYLRGWETISATQRWLAVRMDLCAGLISLLTAVLALNSSSASPAVIGFSMTSSTTLCTALLCKYPTPKFIHTP